MHAPFMITWLWQFESWILPPLVKFVRACFLIFSSHQIWPASQVWWPGEVKWWKSNVYSVSSEHENQQLGVRNFFHKISLQKPSGKISQLGLLDTVWTLLKNNRISLESYQRMLLFNSLLLKYKNVLFCLIFLWSSNPPTGKL